MPESTNNVPAVTSYNPVELGGLYRNYFERGVPNNILWLRGIYVQKPYQNRSWAFAFDELKDEKSNNTVTLKINWQDREKLKPNSLVKIGGLIELSLKPDSSIQIALKVTRFEIIKDQFFTEQELKRIDIKKKKNAAQYKNVNLEISQVLYEGKRPKIALVIAQSTKTQGDFEDGLRSARTAIDFEEYKVSLTQTATLCNTLRNLDTRGYTAIAIYRGGGIDSNNDVDKLEVLEVVALLKTPFISGVGHHPEQIFLRQIADAWTSTPQGLGQFFSDIVESVAAKRNNSKAVLVKEIEGQFKQQIVDSNKKNETLEKRISELIKDNQEHVKELMGQHKTREDKLNGQITELMKQNETQRKENASLRDQLATAQRRRSGCLPMAVAAAVISFILAILL